MCKWFDAQFDQKILDGLYDWVLSSEIYRSQKGFSWRLNDAIISYCVGHFKMWQSQNLLNGIFFQKFGLIPLPESTKGMS